MMVDEENIVEAEIVESSVDETKPREQTPKKVKSDKRKQVLFWGSLARNCMKVGFPLFLLGGFSALAFGIVYSEQKAVFHLVLLIIAISLAGLGVIASAMSIIARRIMVHYMKLDPNFEEQV